MIIKMHSFHLKGSRINFAFIDNFDMIEILAEDIMRGIHMLAVRLSQDHFNRLTTLRSAAIVVPCSPPPQERKPWFTITTSTCDIAFAHLVLELQDCAEFMLRSWLSYLS